MSEFKGTPGPWSIDKICDQDWHILGAASSFCADIVANVYDTDLDESKANARLIAAAPCLLEALIEMERSFGTEFAGGPAVKARVAIKKALQP